MRISIFAVLAVAVSIFICAPAFSLESRGALFTIQDLKQIPQGDTGLDVVDSSSQEATHQKFIEKAEGWEVPSLKGYVKRTDDWADLDENGIKETFAEYFEEMQGNGSVMVLRDRNQRIWAYSKFIGSTLIYTIVDEDGESYKGGCCSAFEKRYIHEEDVYVPDWVK